MKRRFAAVLVGALPLALALAAAPLRAQVQQSSPIDDLLKRAQDAFNDLRYLRADTLARQVLDIGPQLSTAQRTHALLVLAAASYPEEAAAQKPAVALQTLRQIVRTNLDLDIPQELTWSGLDSLAEIAKRTTFGIAVSSDAQQVIAGPEGTASLKVRSNRPGRFHLTVMHSGGAGSAVVVDSAAGPVTAAEFRFAAMRGDRPLFTSGEYDVIVTGVDPASRDTVTVRYTATLDAPPLQLASIPTKVDSTRLLPERTKRFGLKALAPAIITGAAAFALASVLHGEGSISSEAGSDSRGVMVGGVIFASTIAAGLLDRGRPIRANIAANKAYHEEFAKSIVDAEAANRRRVAEYRTTFTLNLERR